MVWYFNDCASAEIWSLPGLISDTENRPLELMPCGFCVQIVFCGAAALWQDRARLLEANHCSCRKLYQIILVVMVVMFSKNNKLPTIWWPLGIYSSVFCLLPFGLWYFKTDSAESIWLQWVSVPIVVTLVIVLLVWMHIIIVYISLIHSLMDLHSTVTFNLYY